MCCYMCCYRRCYRRCYSKTVAIHMVFEVYPRVFSGVGRASPSPGRSLSIDSLQGTVNNRKKSYNCQQSLSVSIHDIITHLVMIRKSPADRPAFLADVGPAVGTGRAGPAGVAEPVRRSGPWPAGVAHGRPAGVQGVPGVAVTGRHRSAPSWPVGRAGRRWGPTSGGAGCSRSGRGRRSAVGGRDRRGWRTVGGGAELAGGRG